MKKERPLSFEFVYEFGYLEFYGKNDNIIFGGEVFSKCDAKWDPSRERYGVRMLAEYLDPECTIPVTTLSPEALKAVNHWTSIATNQYDREYWAHKKSAEMMGEKWNKWDWPYV